VPILGINYDMCISCRECVFECPGFHYKEEENGQIVFDDPRKRCILCGHCIAVCPVDAILHENLGEVETFSGIDNPSSIASYDTIYKFLRTIRAVRRYKKDKVPDVLLERVFNAMKHAPTGANVRSEKITIVSDPEKLKELSNTIIEALMSDSSWKGRFANTFKTLEKEFEIPAFFDAPHLIVVHSPMPMMINYIELGNIITYGRIAAQALGLGTCFIGWTQMANEINPKIKKLVRATGNTLCGFTLGYPDVKYYQIPPRVPLKIRKISKKETIQIPHPL
jgi:ferredoxin